MKSHVLTLLVVQGSINETSDIMHAKLRETYGVRYDLVVMTCAQQQMERFVCSNIKFTEKEEDTFKKNETMRVSYNVKIWSNFHESGNDCFQIYNRG